MPELYSEARAYLCRDPSRLYLVPHPHKHLVFTVPKRIRPYFKYDRKLFKLFYKSAWEAWKWYVEGLLPEGTSGAVMSLHTAGDLLNFHPHVHSLVLPGVITPSGEYQELPEIDTAASY